MGVTIPHRFGKTMVAMNKLERDASVREWRDSAPHWAKHARTIQMMFAPVTHALIEEAAITGGRRVLDVAGGPGEPSLTIAKVVGPSGAVACTDVVLQMVAAAKWEAQRHDLHHLSFFQCAAEALPFASSSFDSIVCRLGAMFFGNPAAALGEMLRVARSGGSMSLAVWGKSELNPFSYLVTRVLSRYFPPSAQVSIAHDAFRFAETDSLASILRQVGAQDVRERVFEFHIEAPISFAEFWTMRSETSGTLREKLQILTPEQRAEVAREVQDSGREFFPNNQMSLPAQVIIVTGRKPSQPS